MAKIWNSIRRLGIELYAFITTPVVFRNIAMIIGLCIAFFVLSMWILRGYTNHGQEIPVGDYEGRFLEDVEKEIVRSKLHYTVTDSIFRLDAKPGVVINQDPVPQAKVKKGRMIYLTVTKTTPDEVLLPEIQGFNEDYNQYARQLNRLGLKSAVNKRIYNNRLENNTILKVYMNGEDITAKIKDGLRVPMGTKISVDVSQRQSSFVTVPDVHCLVGSEAKFMIQSAGLKVGTTVPDEGVTNENTAYVTKQHPAAGQSLDKGETVTLYFKSKAASGCE